MAQFSYPNNTPASTPQTQLRLLPFYFIDEATNTRILLDFNRNNDFRYLVSILRDASAPVATTIKTKAHVQDGEATTEQRPVQHFGRNDGDYLFRLVAVQPGPGGQPLFSRSKWSTLKKGSLPGLFTGPHFRQIGSSIEIQHSLQHFRNIVNRARGCGPVSPPAQHLVQRAPPRLASVMAPNPGTLPAPQSAPLAPPFPPEPAPPPRPASAPAMVVRPPPTAAPMRFATRSPAPITAVGTPVVRLPLVSAPWFVAAMPVAVTPVTTSYAKGVVDSGALAWYRREEKLRGWLRFGEAGVVESEDVWRGW